jgi:DNA-binding CsgD family transcriptional regulator/PAS domain-containing protein
VLRTAPRYGSVLPASKITIMPVDNLKTIEKLQQFSIVVQHVYDAAIDPNHWHEALLQLRQLVGASCASLLYSADIRTENAFPHFLFLSGYSEAFIQALTPEYWSMWTLQANVPAWQVGAIQHLSDMLPSSEFLNSRFYLEVLQPHQQFDYAGMMALKEGPHAVHLNMSTIVEHGPFTAEGIELMRLLAPHVCRAAKIGLALDVKSLQSKQLEATLNTLSAGVFLTSRDGRVVFMNHAAERQIKRRAGIGIINRRLTPMDETAATAFAHYFSAADGANSKRGTEAISIALPDAAGNLVATILPLDTGKRQDLTSGTYAAAFVVFLQDAASTPTPPGAAIAELYGLTPAELRVLLAITQGHTAQAAAAILGVSLATVKTHVQHILHKTGTNRMADVVRLVAQASSPAVVHRDP